MRESPHAWPCLTDHTLTPAAVLADAGAPPRSFSDTSSAVDGDAPAIHARNSEAGHRDIAASWVGPTFTQWQELLEAAKRKRGSRDDDGSSIGVLGA